MKDYELTVLVQPDLEPAIDTALEKVRELVTTNGGEVTKEENWGKKKLAYKINKEDFAVYLYMEVKLPANAPLKISNMLNISDYAMRYLLVKADEKGRKMLEEAKKSEAKKEANEE
ncbi:MAG: 30S ribosomal protein S6 [Candidatus Saccharibacteria bacterium]|jgi:ribosomal protein S6